MRRSDGRGIWRLYMAALNFGAGRTQIRQVLAVKDKGGDLPLRPHFGPEAGGADMTDEEVLRTLARDAGES